MHRPKLQTILVPQRHVGFDILPLTMLDIHPPETESIHSLSQGVVFIEELNRARDIEQNLGLLTHVQSVDCAWVLGDVITWLSLPCVPRKQEKSEVVIIYGNSTISVGKNALVVAPSPCTRVCFDLSSVTMLSQLSVRIGLECDHICAAAILNA